MLGLARKPRGKTVAVVDIGGGSAGVAILEIFRMAPMRVVVSERSVLPIGERAEEASVAGVVAELGKAAEKALAAYSAKRDKEGTPHVSEVYAVVRAPWTRTKTVRAMSALPKETRVDNSMVAALAREAIQVDTEFDHATLLEASVVRVELNGYPTANPQGKEAKTIAVSVLLSDCRSDIRSAVAEALQRVFACPPPVFRSGVGALLWFLRENGLLVKDALIISMASNATSLVVVRKGVFVEIGHVLEGSWTIAHRIAGGKLPEEVFTLIRMLAKDECEGDACEAAKAAIARVEPDLVKVFGEAFVKMAASQRFPNTLILLVPQDLSEWLQHFFTRIDFAQFTITMQPLSPIIPEMGVDRTKTSEHTLALDPGLAVACALVNTGEKLYEA